MTEQIKPLKIALIGYNREQTINALKIFFENNKEDVICFNKYGRFILFKDETVIQAIFNEDNLRGQRFDQLILCDDSRWNIKIRRRGFIDYVRLNMMSHSCVPEDYQIMHYEI